MSKKKSFIKNKDRKLQVDSAFERGMLPGYITGMPAERQFDKFEMPYGPEVLFKVEEIHEADAFPGYTVKMFVGKREMFHVAIDNRHSRQALDRPRSDRLPVHMVIYTVPGTMLGRAHYISPIDFLGMVIDMVGDDVQWLRTMLDNLGWEV